MSVEPAHGAIHPVASKSLRQTTMHSGVFGRNLVLVCPGVYCKPVPKNWTGSLVAF